LEQVKRQPVDVNPKGQLQEILQAISPASPAYEVISQSGPEHAKHFVVRATWDGVSLGEGSGRSKKEAETAAASDALQQKRWEQKSRDQLGA
jgi:ribonuclease-3